MPFRNPDKHPFRDADPVKFKYDIIRFRALCAYYSARTSMRLHGVKARSTESQQEKRRLAELAYERLQGIIAEYEEDFEDTTCFRKSKQLADIRDAHRFFAESLEKVAGFPPSVLAQIYRLQKEYKPDEELIYRLEILLDKLTELTAGLAKIENKGGRPADHAQTRLIRHTADLMGIWTGRNIVKSFQTAKGKLLPDGKYERVFVQPEMTVIFELAHAIEPNLNMSQIKSALQNADLSLDESKNHPRQNHRFLD